jgi:hypothetical protein
MRDLIQPGWWGSTGSFASGVIDFFVPFNTWNDDAKKRVSDLDKELTKLIADGHADKAQQQFSGLVRSAGEWGGTVEDVRNLLPGYTAAMDSMGSETGSAASQTDALTAATRGYKTELNSLPGVLDRVERRLAQRTAKRALAAAEEQFFKKPTKENSDAVASALTAYARTFKDPENGVKKADAALDKFNEKMRDAGTDDSLRKYFKQTVSDLNLFITQAGTAKQGVIDLQNAIARHYGTGSNPKPGNGRWMGGRVYGPGSSTSDSILTPLSNGEYVLRAHAANALGDGILGRLNQWDRLGSTERAPIARKLAAATPPAPRVMPVPVAVGAGGRRGGDINVRIDRIEKGVDWRAEMDAWDRMRQANMELVP